MTRILIIGNSFGGDCSRYVYDVARADGKKVKIVNLYIGGCSLYRHYRNMLSGADAYEYEINGHRTGINVSLKEGLLSDEWDYIVTQQCSPLSGESESYEPYASALADYVRLHAPHAKFMVHQTWTFETGAPRFKLTSYETPETMFPAIEKNYAEMAERTRAWGIIPDGEAMFTLWQRRAEYGIEAVHRDGFHADLGVGRYLLALTFYSTVTGRDISENSFDDFDIEVTPEAAAAARAVATEIVAKYRPINEELAKNAL